MTATAIKAELLRELLKEYAEDKLPDPEDVLLVDELLRQLSKVPKLKS